MLFVWRQLRQDPHRRERHPDRAAAGDYRHDNERVSEE
jgi:hypothetical protein